MLGFRGHFLTKSRHNSSTFAERRQVRADFRARQERRERGLPEDLDDAEGSTLVLAHRAYAGHGHSPGESWLEASIARDIRQNRETAREELPALLHLEGTPERPPRPNCSPSPRSWRDSRSAAPRRTT
ncbi:hypothetical protein AQJ27_26660 [Streptomyces olivochromogenes]|uniref:Replication initiation protein n=1 Tax=Streptomyces olivochromogenes TaxID=1963 RepID=A0A250VGA0_STROL|nr:hypothetical protein AQJ27_26660 [Streptomyces olivochromogenes]GAX53096.1 replication initiation protein [Streptomyces olivochromogenes]